MNRLMVGEGDGSDVRATRTSLVGILVVLTVLVSPLAVAQAEDLFIGATTQVRTTIDLTAATEDYARSGAGRTDLAGCGSDHFSYQANDGWFRFAEEQAENGCGEARFRFDVPPGATRVTVGFAQDRSLTPITAQATAPLAIQQVHVRTPAGKLLQNVPTFAPDAPASEPQMFQVSYDLGAPDRVIDVGWYFEDAGSDNQGGVLAPSGTYRFHSAVSQVVITFEGGRVDGARFSLTDRDPSTSRLKESYAFESNLRGTAPVADLLLRFTRAVSLVSVEGPSGTLPLTAASAGPDAAGVFTVRLSGSQVASQGSGVYRLLFETIVPLSPDSSLVPFALLISIAPAVPASYGALALSRLRRRARDEGIAMRLVLQTPFLTLIALYALTLFTLGVTGEWFALMLAPLATRAFSYGAIFIGLSFGFLLVATFGIRRQSNELADEIHRLRRTQRALKRSNDELQLFAYIASHDLQEPLRTISGFGELLRRRYGDRLDERGVRYLDRIDSGVDRMSRLIHDLLVYSRVESKGASFSKVAMDKIVDDAIISLSRVRHETDAIIRHDALPVIMADGAQVSQAINNLLTNAIKYRYPDRRPDILVGSHRVANGWAIWVRDNGMGIPAESADRVFQIFQRLVPQDSHIDGTGIGLAIVKRIMARHHGYATVESEPDAGCTFTLTFPDDPENTQWTDDAK